MTDHFARPPAPASLPAGGSAAEDSPRAELSSDVLDLLAAIRDALDVPLPSLAEADERAWHRLMARRLSELHVTLSVALDPKWADGVDAAHEAAQIRQRTAATPVTYTVWEAAEAAPEGGEQR
jgi:hypothetical protein